MRRAGIPDHTSPLGDRAGVADSGRAPGARVIVPSVFETGRKWMPVSLPQHGGAMPPKVVVMTSTYE